MGEKRFWVEEEEKKRREKERDARGRGGREGHGGNPKGHGAAFCPRRFQPEDVWRSPRASLPLSSGFQQAFSMHGLVTRTPSKADINHAFLPHKTIRHLLPTERRAHRRPRHPHPSFQPAPCSLPAHSKAHQPASCSWRDYPNRLHPQPLSPSPQHREGHVRSQGQLLMAQASNLPSSSKTTPPILSC